jgi:hypothetical protein
MTSGKTSRSSIGFIAALDRTSEIWRASAGRGLIGRAAACRAPKSPSRSGVATKLPPGAEGEPTIVGGEVAVGDDAAAWGGSLRGEP